VLEVGLQPDSVDTSKTRLQHHTDHRIQLRAVSEVVGLGAMHQKLHDSEGVVWPGTLRPSGYDNHDAVLFHARWEKTTSGVETGRERMWPVHGTSLACKTRRRVFP
jgi:hypothetical protein